tara:strand:- start:142 stop:981 length:840 start_codon:yes stop_codon:yes gene_type:complete
MDNFDYKKYLAEGKLYLSENASLDVDVNTEEDEVEVTYNGESYKSALGDELLFIHYFGDGEYHSENDAPEIFKYLKEKGGELEVDDDEATLTIKMSDLAESVNESLPDNITSVVDDMTITMGEDAFIAAIFKALSLEDAKKVLRVITKDNPIENVLGPVTYDWLNEGKLNEASKLDQAAGGYPYKMIGNKAVIVEPMDTATKERAIKKAKSLGLRAKPNMQGGINIYTESVNENIQDNQWTAYVKSLINDIRLNGVEQYTGFREDDILEDFENYIADKF